MYQPLNHIFISRECCTYAVWSHYFTEQKFSLTSDFVVDFLQSSFFKNNHYHTVKRHSKQQGTLPFAFDTEHISVKDIEVIKGNLFQILPEKFENSARIQNIKDCENAFGKLKDAFIQDLESIRNQVNDVSLEPSFFLISTNH